MFALSVSISAIGWPRFTSSPSETSHLRIVPSSIESDRRGIVISDISAVPERGQRGLHDVLLVRERCLLERLRVRHRHVGSRYAHDRRVEPVERLLLDERGQVRPHAAMWPAFLDDDRAVRLLDRIDDRVQVEWPQRAWVDHLRLDLVLRGKGFGRLTGGD